MKNMSKKKTLIIGLSIIAACLLFCVGYLFVTRSPKREPTQQEIEAYAPYAIDWQSTSSTEGSDKQIILEMCSFAKEKTIGENVYQIYTSDILGSYLYQFGEMTEIAEMQGTLYIQYTDSDGNTVTLGYTDEGLMEKAVYCLETDTLYYEQDGLTEVWEKFGSGIQWGA